MATKAALAAEPERVLTLDRVPDAPVEKLWRCWTEPGLIEQWFCPRPWYVTGMRIDPRPGGEFSAVMNGPDELDDLDDLMRVRVELVLVRSPGRAERVTLARGGPRGGHVVAPSCSPAETESGRSAPPVPSQRCRKGRHRLVAGPPGRFQIGGIHRPSITEEPSPEIQRLLEIGDGFGAERCSQRLLAKGEVHEPAPDRTGFAKGHTRSHAHRPSRLHHPAPTTPARPMHRGRAPRPKSRCVPWIWPAYARLSGGSAGTGA